MNEWLGACLSDHSASSKAGERSLLRQVLRHLVPAMFLKRSKYGRRSPTVSRRGDHWEGLLVAGGLLPRRGALVDAVWRRDTLPRCSAGGSGRAHAR
jgi:hypothetical protein